MLWSEIGICRSRIAGANTRIPPQCPEVPIIPKSERRPIRSAAQRHPVHFAPLCCAAAETAAQSLRKVQIGIAQYPEIKPDFPRPQRYGCTFCIAALRDWPLCICSNAVHSTHRRCDPATRSDGPSSSLGLLRFQAAAHPPPSCRRFFLCPEQKRALARAPLLGSGERERLRA